MADNKLELVVTVEVDKANQSIKSVNASLSSMEASATKSAKGATQGIDGITNATRRSPCSSTPSGRRDRVGASPRGLRNGPPAIAGVGVV